MFPAKFGQSQMCEVLLNWCWKQGLEKIFETNPKPTFFNRFSWNVKETLKYAWYPMFPAQLGQSQMSQVLLNSRWK